MIVINGIDGSKGKRVILGDCVIGSVAGSLSGKTVIIKNGSVFIDGKPVEEYEEENHERVFINVTVQGDCEQIENCDSVKVNGSCGKIRTHNGEVRIGGDVKGSVSTHNGNITCGNVGGDVDTHNGNITYVRK